MTTINTIATVATYIVTGEIVTVIEKKKGGWTKIQSGDMQFNVRNNQLVDTHEQQVDVQIVEENDSMVIAEHTIDKSLVFSVAPRLAANLVLTEGYEDVGIRAGLTGYIVFQIMKLFNQFPVGDKVLITEFADVAERKFNAILKLQHDDGLWLDYECQNIVKVMIDLKVLQHDAMFCAPTARWYDMIGEVTGAALPSTEPITEETRIRNHIKHNKVRVCASAKDRLAELASHAYHVCPWMLAIYQEAMNSQEVIEYKEVRRDGTTKIVEKLAESWTVFKSNRFAVEGCEKMKNEPALYSDWFYDLRGRSYFIRCAGPNPQSSDFTRSVHSHNVKNKVKKDSRAYWMFIAEMRDIIGGIDQCANKKADDKEWLNANIDLIKQVNAKPASYLRRMLKNEEQNTIHSIDPNWKDLKTASKPCTFVRMCIEFMAWENSDNGYHDCRMSFGLDAKNSGAQYIGFIAGCQMMAKATGLTADTIKALDPYMMASNTLNERKEKCTNEMIRNLPDGFFTRNFVKRPFMAVQYSGTWKALFGSKEFTDPFVKIGFKADDLRDVCEFTVAGILDSFGQVINAWMNAIKEGVADTMGDKAFFSYYHTDGFKVTNPVYSSIKIGEVPFKVRIDDNHGQKQYIDFGSFEENKPWEIEQHTIPNADEFIRTFIVHYIQGIDALVARTITKKAHEHGLRGFTAIHDCFRCCLEDAPEMKAVIAEAYKEVFIDEDGGNKQLRHLMNNILKGNMHYVDRQVVTEELLDSENSYYFC